MSFQKTLLSRLLLLFVLGSVYAVPLLAQVPGQVALFNNAGQAVSCNNGPLSALDPNGDCSIANTTSGLFSGSGVAEVAEFEALASGQDLLIPWTQFTGLDMENSGDTYQGGPCNGADLIADGVSSGSFAYYSAFNYAGTEYIAFRIRTANFDQGDYGFNILVSNDGMLGGMGPTADPDYLFGNPGFEREIRFKSEGNSQTGVYVYDVNGLNSLADSVAPITGLAFPNNWQAAYASYNSLNCSASNDAVFYTLYVPVTALGIPEALFLDQVEVVLTTTAGGSSFFSPALSDIGGLIGLGLSNPCNCNVIPNNCTETYTDCMLACLATQLTLNTNFPVVWQGVTARIIDTQIDLSWTVSQEINNDYFTIERKTGAGVFEPIARLSGRGSSETTKTYTYSDIIWQYEATYYRIRQTDFDGSFSYSPVVNVHPSGEADAGRLSAIPGSGELQLQWFSRKPRTGFVSLLDMSGKEIERRAVHFYEGQNHMPFRFPALPPGVYLFQILGQGGHAIYAEKFIWQ